MLSRALSKQFQYVPVTVKEFTSGLSPISSTRPDVHQFKMPRVLTSVPPTKELRVQISPGFVSHRGSQATHPAVTLLLACFLVLEARNQDLQTSHSNIYLATIYRLHMLLLGTVSPRNPSVKYKKNHMPSYYAPPAAQ